jgi:hypothetical protein
MGETEPVCSPDLLLLLLLLRCNALLFVACHGW